MSTPSRRAAGRRLPAMALLALAGCAPSPAPSDAAADAPPAADVADAPAVTSAPPGFRAQLDPRGTLTLEVGGVRIAGVELVAHLASGDRTLSSMRVTVEGDTATGTADGATLRLTLTRAQGRDALTLAWRAEGLGALEGIGLAAPPHALPGDARVVMDGAQSWSFAGALSLPPGATLPRDARGAVTFPDSLGDPLVDAAGVSLFRGDIAWGSAGLSACAAAPWRRWSALAVERPDARWRWELRTGLRADEAVSLAPGAPAYEGRWVLTPARDGQAFACSDDAPPPARTRGARPFPRAWWSWNTLFERVTAAQVEAQVAPLRALDARADAVVLDDGWERAWGDWREREGFGATLADLAARLRARGVSLGLWLAPFAVDPTAPLVREHPEWLLRDVRGELLAAPLVPGRSYHVLDATRPEVRAHLTALFRDLRARGVTLFKIDFLYAESLRAARAMSSVPPLEAYRMGLEAIAEGAGDAHVNGCGAVVLPSLPYVDSMRVGADNAFATSPPFWAAVSAAARNLAVRAPLARWGVAPDPDQPIARGYTADEARAFLAVGALSGGAFGYGDDLTALDEPRRALYREAWFTRLRDGLTRPAAAVDATRAVGDRLLASPVLDGAATGFRATRAAPAAVWVADLAGGERDVAVFNWADDERAVEVAASLVGGAVRECVAGATVTRAGDAWRVTVPRHGVRVLSGATPR